MERIFWEIQLLANPMAKLGEKLANFAGEKFNENMGMVYWGEVRGELLARSVANYVGENRIWWLLSRVVQSVGRGGVAKKIFQKKFMAMSGVGKHRSYKGLQRFLQSCHWEGFVIHFYIADIVFSGICRLQRATRCILLPVSMEVIIFRLPQPVIQCVQELTISVGTAGLNSHLLFQ